MREFRHFDIEIVRGIQFEMPAEIRDSDGAFVPIGEVASPEAWLTGSDDYDGAVTVAMSWDWLDSERTTIRFWLSETDTDGLVVGNSGFWFSKWVDAAGDIVPLYRGRVSVK